MQAQPQIMTRGQDRTHVAGKVCQQTGELGQRARRGQLVQIIDDQRDVVTSIGKLPEQPVSHCPPIEVG
jgi:hypothetical protein